MSSLVTEEGYEVKWFNKQWAVIRTSGLFTGRMYQVYERIGDTSWERRPKNGITLFKTIKSAKEWAKAQPTTPKS